MLSERQLEALMEVFNARMQKVVDLYLKQMGEHLRDIGQLTPSDVHKLTELKRMRANVNRIKREIARAARSSAEDVEKVFRAVAASNEAFARQYYAAAQEAPVKGAAQRSQPMERILKAQLRITNQEMRNLSQTTIVSDAYRRAVDVAVQTVQGGLTSYNAAIRDAVKAAGVEGVLVRFPSGYSRRLDSAVRQNVLDGVRAVNNDTLRQLGKEFGADGIEISLHALCATDHLPYQGRRFTNRQFERLQNSLARPFGMWNCKHSMFPVLMSAPPLHTEEEIEEYRRNSAEKIEIDGKTRSRYEWTQEQRRIEAAIRQQKDIANLARASGDMQEARKASARIGKLYERYDRISDAAGLDKQYSRGYVRGYRETRAAKATTGGQPRTQRVSSASIADTPKAIKPQQPLQKQGGKRIIKTNDAVVFFKKAAEKEEAANGINSFTIDENESIINSSMQRKTTANGQRIPAMPKKRLQKIVKSFKRKGGTVLISKETDEHLDKMQATGVTLQSDLIMLHSNSSRAAVFEELIHSAQYRDGKIDGSALSIIKCEIEAKEKLIRCAKAYKLSEAEVLETKALLQKEYERLKALQGDENA